MEIVLMLVAMFVLMYFMTIRPQKKRMEEQQKTLRALAPGNRVLMNNGMFGTLVASGEKQSVVALAPGVEVTVLSQMILRPVTAEEEEFEFTDADAQVLGTMPVEPVDSFTQPDDGDLETSSDLSDQSGFERPVDETARADADSEEAHHDDEFWANQNKPTQEQ